MLGDLVAPCRISGAAGQVWALALLPVPAATVFDQALCFGIYSLVSTAKLFESFLTTFSDGCLGSNNDEGRSEV